MSIFNSVFSSITGKRTNGGSEAIQNLGHKKQRVHNGAIRKEIQTTISNHEDKTNEYNLTDLKNQANKNQSKIVTTNNTPQAYLTKNVYSTTLINKIVESTAFNYNERLVWSLGTLLFGQEELTVCSNDGPSRSLTTTVSPKQRRRLRNWICNTVVKELKQRNLLNMDIDKIEDGWKRAFYYLSSGQVIQACELVQQLGDDALATMMVVHFQQEVDVCNQAQNQVLYWQERGLFDSMPLYRRKMWYVLQGQLGYVNHIKAVVTEDLSWPQVLLLYSLYGGHRGDLNSGLSAYRTLTSSHGSGVNGLHQLRARKHTASVPSDCLWYNLLQWWSSSTSSSANDAIYRKELELALPLQCRWVLLLHVSPMFEHGDDDLESWKQQWCDELYKSELEYMAIHAGLYLSSPEVAIRKLLSRRQLEKEHYLCRQLQIPTGWITDSKAWYALNQQLYDKEVDYYLDAKENEKARDAILNHMIPALFFDGRHFTQYSHPLERLPSHYHPALIYS
ncbi:MAG: hypothetical protein EZS28_023262 [Streblomastix strix]|uniref:Nuclear pore complex protein NUP96 C-terminal domain-containing protein n=1 Tax=Streblomastix strix TaxID=222440 RepID=A0A5J4VFH7_9EUKA|nr:MAG: hypothetical protein EZS28_023262 [Streblomastix strix]